MFWQCSNNFYFKENIKEPYILAKVVKEDNLSVLIVNLYAGNEGYSLMLRKKDGSEVETVKLPYEVSGNIIMLLIVILFDLIIKKNHYT